MKNIQSLVLDGKVLGVFQSHTDACRARCLLPLGDFERSLIQPSLLFLEGEKFRLQARGDDLELQPKFDAQPPAAHACSCKVCACKKEGGL